MISYYYQCKIQDGFGLQKLDDYEVDLGFMPVWIDLKKAIEINNFLLNSSDPPRWLEREVLVLEYIRDLIAESRLD
jgi:hypothetical protein